jgi:NAD dependent epimerase/dehydratase family enzyme
MRIIITGRTGLIGRALAAKPTADDHIVYQIQENSASFYSSVCYML